jgi:hypothetical protein
MKKGWVSREMTFPTTDLPTGVRSIRSLHATGTTKFGVFTEGVKIPV